MSANLTYRQRVEIVRNGSVVERATIDAFARWEHTSTGKERPTYFTVVLDTLTPAETATLNNCANNDEEYAFLLTVLARMPMANVREPKAKRDGSGRAVVRRSKPGIVVALDFAEIEGLDLPEELHQRAMAKRETILTVAETASK